MFITMKNATKWRHFTSYVSVALMVISIGMIAVKGLNWGLDFTGGIVTEVQMNANISNHEIDSTMDKALKQDVSVIAAGEPGRWYCVMRSLRKVKRQTLPTFCNHWMVSYRC
ncbi:protein-export membrane protein SecF [Photobacterium aphoticum]|uniref:Protein-export membrane protein SecF n=1 Tax=Photobacterium aphoticum TaxID=754436 RepID=A0A090QKI0_9GAMM|nr:protein-export membrane protein SecF [Photobacterium aphoticum]